ncbi:MAG: hypothetical protein LIP10_12955 [Clostridiales bacterium]|nr:hypothetical protein [Clostridiales bacterium]
MSKDFTPEEKAAIDSLKEECDLFAFTNYLERHHGTKEQQYSDEEFRKFKEKVNAISRPHEDSEQLEALKYQSELLLADAEYDVDKLLYNHRVSIDSDTLAKMARINYYTIIEMQKCGYSPEEIEYRTYYWPY